MSVITCEVLIKIMNGLVMSLEELGQENFICLATLLCEQFCRFANLANGGAKISIKSYFTRSFFLMRSVYSAALKC